MCHLMSADCAAASVVELWGVGRPLGKREHMLTRLLKTDRSINVLATKKKEKKRFCLISAAAATSPFGCSEHSSRRHRSPDWCWQPSVASLILTLMRKSAAIAPVFCWNGGKKQEWGQRNHTHCGKFLTTADRGLKSQAVCQLYHKTPEATHTRQTPDSHTKGTRAVKHVVWGHRLVVTLVYCHLFIYVDNCKCM